MIQLSRELSEFFQESPLSKIGTLDDYLEYLNNFFEESRLEFRGDIKGLNSLDYLERPRSTHSKGFKYGPGVYTTPIWESAKIHADEISGKVYLVLVNTKDLVFFSDRLSFLKEVSNSLSLGNRVPTTDEISKFTKSIHEEGKSIHIKRAGTMPETTSPSQNIHLMGSERDVEEFRNFVRIRRAGLMEKNLNFDELKRDFGGQKKGDILIKKIMDQEDLTFVDSGSGVKKIQKVSQIKPGPDQIITPQTIGDYLPFDDGRMLRIFKKEPGYKDYKKSIVSDDGTVYKLNDIVKTSDFGSSGGSSLGTENTIKIESIYCLYFSIRQFLSRDISITDDIDYFLESPSVMDFVRTPVQISSQTLEDFANWEFSFIQTVNGINKTEKYLVKSGKSEGVLRSDIKYRFHQINSKDTLIFTLLQKYNSFRLDIPISKWTPSDIWAINSDTESQTIRKISQTRTIDELNLLTNQLFDQGELVGISLKKITPREEDFKIIINNESPKPKYSLERFNLVDDPTQTLNITLVARRTSEVYGDGEEKIDFRSFSGENKISDISGEVIGKDARFGKISLKIINRILLSYGLGSVDVYGTFENTPQNILEKKLEEIQGNLLGLPIIKISSSRVEKLKTRRRLISKLQSLQLTRILCDNWKKKPKLTDKIINELFYYALSIENEFYESPKYIRII
ncbi:hypothetical protein EBU71_06250 [bacterium]|nr:hypothetical protein [Candidatus Elulimicrobium humile]